MILSPRVKLGVKFPEFVFDLDGIKHDVKKLRGKYELIVITLKAAWCPVCPILLQLLDFLGRKPSAIEFVDPFSQSPRMIPENRNYNSLLLNNDAFFIVLSPGPHKDLVSIRDNVGWKDDRCIFVEDVGLEISQTLGILMIPPVGVWPGIMHIERELDVTGIEFGRGPGHYGEVALLKFLSNNRKWAEALAVDSGQDLCSHLTQLSTIPDIYQHPGRDKLPVEVTEAILGQLDGKQRRRVSCVSRSWRTIVAGVYTMECKRAFSKLTEYLPVDDDGQLIINGSPAAGGLGVSRIKYASLTELRNFWNQEVDALQKDCKLFLHLWGATTANLSTTW